MMRKWIFPAVIVMATAALYFNSLGNHFAYDDKIIILNNGYLNHFAESLSSFFSMDYFNVSGENSYRPVATLTYLINYRIWQLNPFGYHLFSVLLHIVNVLLLYLLLNRLFKNDLFSLVCCLIYSFHPVLTEAVDCITFNEDLLVSIFFLGALISYLKASEKSPIRISYYAASLLFYFLAMLSKESGLVLLAVILLYDFFLAGDALPAGAKTQGAGLKAVPARMAAKIGQNKYLYLGYPAVGAFYSILSFVIFKSPDKIAPSLHHDFFTRLIYLPYNLFQFIKLSVIPRNLMNDYHFSYPDAFFGFANVTAWIVVAALIISSFFVYRYSKKIFWGLGWFMITLIPVLNIVEILNPMAERYLYLPLIGFAVVIGSLIWELSDKFFSFRKSYAVGIRVVLTLALCLTYSHLTFYRNFVWKDDASLCRDVIAKDPANYKAYYGLGYDYYSKGAFDDAATYFRRALEAKADYAPAHNALGNIHLNRKQYDQAKIEFQQAIKADPLDNTSYYNLGNVLRDKGDIEGAIEAYRESIRIHPKAYGSYYNLGLVYVSQGRFPDAVDAFKNAIRINDHHSDAHFNLAMTYLKQNEMDAALAELLIVIQLAPGEAMAYSLAGELYTAGHDYDKAEKYLLMGIKNNPAYSETYFNLGIVYAVQEKFNDAIAQWEKVLLLDPHNDGARKNIELAKKMLKKEF